MYKYSIESFYIIYSWYSTFAYINCQLIVEDSLLNIGWLIKEILLTNTEFSCNILAK